MSPTVTISMPVGPGMPQECLERAIAAVRAQTYRSWRLVVIGDGAPAMAGMWRAFADGDKRVVGYAYPENRGRYYADAVVFAATTSPFFTVHDADDEAAPEWLATMIAACASADVALTSQHVRRLNGRAAVESVSGFRGAHTLHHHAHMAGLWSRKWLDDVGGPHPAFRVGFDTLLTSLPFLLGMPAIINDPVLYRRHKRVMSLTTSVSTGMRSPMRLRARDDLIALYSRILDGLRTVGGERDRRAVVREVLAQYPTREAYAELRADVEREAKRLADLIGEGA